MRTGEFFVSVAAVLALASGGGRLPGDEVKTDRVASLIKELINDLGHDEFAKREAASMELKTLGEPALDALRKAAASHDPEIRKRAEDIIRAITKDRFVLESDVSEIDSRKFGMPIMIRPDKQAEIAKIRLYVSEDRGKTWKHHADYSPKDELATYTAPRDGLYWFALQIVSRDGKIEPPDLDKLIPGQKVYVNSERKALKKQ